MRKRSSSSKQAKNEDERKRERKEEKRETQKTKRVFVYNFALLAQVLSRNSKISGIFTIRKLMMSSSMILTIVTELDIVETALVEHDQTSRAASLRSLRQASIAVAIDLPASLCLSMKAYPGDGLLCSKRTRKRPYQRRFQSNTFRKVKYSKVITRPVIPRTTDTVPST
jgi:hypothetical protein